MAKSKDGIKRSRGRPALPGRRVVIKLEEEHIRRAIKLGGGGNNAMSKGVRKALSS